MVNQGSSYITAGVIPAALGNRHPSIASYQTLQAADRPLVVAVGNDRQFGELCAAVGLPRLAEHPRFRTNPLRVENREALIDLLAPACATESAAHWVDRLSAVGVPCGPVNDLSEAIDLATKLGLSPIVAVAEDEPVRRQLANPINYSETPVDYRLPPPSLGQHTEEAMRWLEDTAPSDLPGAG